MTINTFFIIYKGAKGLGLDKTPVGVAIGTAFGVGAFSAIATIPFVPRIKKFVNDKFANGNIDIELTDI